MVRIADLSKAAADTTAPKRQRLASRIMYIEQKAGELIGPARIGRVTFSRTGCTLYYRDQTFQSLKGQGYKANYFEEPPVTLTGFLGRSVMDLISSTVRGVASRLMLT